MTESDYTPKKVGDIVSLCRGRIIENCVRQGRTYTVTFVGTYQGLTGIMLDRCDGSTLSCSCMNPNILNHDKYGTWVHEAFFIVQPRLSEAEIASAYVYSKISLDEALDYFK